MFTSDSRLPHPTSFPHPSPPPPHPTHSDAISPAEWNNMHSNPCMFSCRVIRLWWNLFAVEIFPNDNMLEVKFWTLTLVVATRQSKQKLGITKKATVGMLHTSKKKIKLNTKYLFNSYSNIKFRCEHMPCAKLLITVHCLEEVIQMIFSFLCPFLINVSWLAKNIDLQESLCMSLPFCWWMFVQHWFAVSPLFAKYQVGQREGYTDILSDPFS